MVQWHSGCDRARDAGARPLTSGHSGDISRCHTGGGVAFLTRDISAILSVIMEAYISAALGSFSANISAQAHFRAGALRAPESHSISAPQAGNGAMADGTPWHTQNSTLVLAWGAGWRGWTQVALPSVALSGPLMGSSVRCGPSLAAADPSTLCTSSSTKGARRISAQILY